MAVKALVLWSGGVESTSLLLHLLKNTDVEVHAHFIEMHNPEQRHQREMDAIAALMDPLQNIREFDFSRSHFSLDDGKVLVADYALQYPIGLVMMQNKNCSCLYRAGCLEDDWDRFGTPTGFFRYERPDPAPGASHKARVNKIVPGYSKETPGDVMPYHELYAKPKAWHVAHLGNLFPLTWSCRRPRGLETCGKCHSCQDRDAAERGTSFNPEVAKLMIEESRP